MEKSVLFSSTTFDNISFSIPDIEKITNKETVIFCPQKVANKLIGYNVKQVGPGESVSFENINIETVPSYNENSVFLWIKAHPESSKNVGYIITINDHRIYYAGDTDFIPEMCDIKDISVALIPIDGDNLTMDPVQAFEAVKKINPSIVIPVHYVVDHNGQSENLNMFIELINNSFELKILHNQKLSDERNTL